MSGTGLKAEPYDLSEIARIGALFILGDLLEDIMPEPCRLHRNGDQIDFREEPYNALKRVLLLTERIDPRQDVSAALWVLRPDDPGLCEVMVAGRRLPLEGYDVIPVFPELARAFAGLMTRRDLPEGETVYMPVLNSEGDTAGVLEVSRLTKAYWI